MPLRNYTIVTLFCCPMMESIFIYSLSSAFVLILLYIPYMLILRQESFFRLNRAVLLFILFLSLVLPMMDIHPLAWERLAPVQEAVRQFSVGNAEQHAVILLPEVDVRATASHASPLHWISMFFVLIMLFVALLRIYQIIHIGVVMRRGSLWQQTFDGVRIYCHADDVPPYSWMNSVVINEKDYKENGREILLHETAHVRARHSTDLLFLAIVQTLQWWNPLAYILGGSLRDVHEYEADDSVLRHGVSARVYQLLIIKKVVGSGSYAFANNFDHSLIIKRITMMQKSKSGKWMYSKVLYLLPMATLALSAFATVSPSGTSTNAADVNSIADYEGKVSTLPVNKQAKEQKNAAFTLPLAYSRAGRGSADSIKASADYCVTPGVTASFPGGEAELYKFIGKTMRYPAKALELGVQGRVIVRFLVGKDGSISDIRIEREVADAVKLYTTIVTVYAKDGKAEEFDKADCQAAVDACSEEVIRTVKAMPKWTPAYRDKAKTRPCATHFVLPVIFRLN